MTRTPHDHIAISAFLQRQLHTRGREDVPAVEAAQWLATVLTEGAKQRPPQRYGRWFIRQLVT